MNTLYFLLIIYRKLLFSNTLCYSLTFVTIYAPLNVTMLSDSSLMFKYLAHNHLVLVILFHIDLIDGYYSVSYYY